MHSHLAQSYPDEGCGILIARPSTTAPIHIHRAIATRNSETVRGEDRYSIDPLDYRSIEAELDRGNDGSRIAAFFHSHPDAPARPSAVDLEMAQGLFDVTRAFYVYAIVRVNQGVPVETRFWRLNVDASQFTELSAQTLAE